MTVVAIALGGWLLIGTLVLLTHDPRSFAAMVWATVTIVLWPVALIASTLLDRRRAAADG